MCRLDETIHAFVMKYIIASVQLAWILLIPVNTYAKNGDEILPMYSITENAMDNALGTHEALFIFRFKYIPLPAKIKGACNKIKKKITISSTGEYTLKTVPGKYIFQFYYNEEFYEIYTDSIEIKPGYRIEIDVNFMSSIYPIYADKPVIYAYAPESTKVNLHLDVKGEMRFTYPVYNKGWEFSADPNGTIHMDGKEYKYLFWEGSTHINIAKINWTEGSLVATNNLLNFLEKTLTTMGLSTSEQQDYITYWYPLMCKNEKNYVHFLFNEEYNEYANISITPKPDHMFRVFMLWTNADSMNEIQLKEQVIPTFKHEGFTVVEWGGSQLESLPIMNGL
jgi:hypothetical protein